MPSRLTVQDVLEHAQRDADDEAVWEDQKWAPSRRPRRPVRPHRLAHRCQQDYAREVHERHQEQRRLRHESERQADRHMEASLRLLEDPFAAFPLSP